MPCRRASSSARWSTEQKIICRRLHGSGFPGAPRAAGWNLEEGIFRFHLPRLEFRLVPLSTVHCDYSLHLDLISTVVYCSVRCHSRLGKLIVVRFLR